MTLRVAVSFGLLVLIAATLSAPAAAQRAQWTEVHAGFAGGSNALSTGGEIGIARDWSGRWTSLGYGANWMYGETAVPEQHMWAMVVSSRVRLHLPTPLTPYVEAGLNVYFVGYEKIDDEGRERSYSDGGPSFGAGLAWRAREHLDVRVGVVAHIPRTDDDAGESEGWTTGLLGISFR